MQNRKFRLKTKSGKTVLRTLPITLKKNNKEVEREREEMLKKSNILV